MGPQRYERVSANDKDSDPTSPQINQPPEFVPASPPPSFRSRASSITSRNFVFSEDPVTSDAERTLADTFDDGGGSDYDGEDFSDDRQRLMRGNIAPTSLVDGSDHDEIRSPAISLDPTVTTQRRREVVSPVGRLQGGGAQVLSFSSANDGVFANLNAKPERGEKSEEQPPSYEQAAADATPPYWETTILAPGMVSDEVYVDGLPVGSLFSFVWNGIISMSFQLVGFLLTYLLHTTHAAKNGSRAGLGVTLIQYGFYIKGSNSNKSSNTEPQYGQPADPNSHDFDPSQLSDSASKAVAAMANSQGGQESVTVKGGISGIASSAWLAYILMIVGWFILIRAVSDFFKARRHEQLVLQSPERGLNVPVVAEGEHAETVV